MTRQILQTIATSRIASAFKMTRRPFQTEFIYTSCIVSASQMTRQILQTGATSSIPSACKMTRHLFQTESYFLHCSWDDAVDRRKLGL